MAHRLYLILPSLLGAACLMAGCRTSTMHVPPDSSRPGGADSYAARRLDPDEEPGGKALPRCVNKNGEPLPAAAFSPSTNDADYRAIVQITIGPNGEALNPCFRAVEGPLSLEEKALAERTKWKFDPAFAGQKRDRTVTFRLRR